ncbi:MAG: alpha/beta hydrolase [Pseudomonadota bacterium]
MRIFATTCAALTATTLCLAATALCVPAPLYAAPPALTSSRAEQRLAHVSIITVGTGDPIVLIPGLGTPRAVWGPLVPRLAKNHQLILVQVNGFGGSDPGANLAPGVLDGIVADLHDYLGEHQIGAVPVIGHSMGGLAALQLALAHPQDVKRLMIVDALPFFGALIDEQATVEAIRPMAQMMQRKVASTYGQSADREAAEANVKGLTLKPGNVAKMVGWSIAADPRVMGELMFEDLTTDVRPKLAGLKVPTTLLYPYETATDEVKTLAFYKRQYALAPTIVFTGIAQSAHMVMLDQPARFAAAVERFVGAR